MLDDILSTRVDDLARTLHRVRLPRHPLPAEAVGDDIDGDDADDERIDLELEHLALPAGFWTYVEQKVQMRANNLYHAANDLQSKLGDIEQLEGSVREQELEQAWKNFGQLRSNANEIFAEFVELVAGLAFRERSRDWWVFRAADSVVTECAELARQRWDPVTVPGLKHAIARTLEQVVRLRFPDWTIWALPITAYEFWRVYLPSDDDQPRLAQQFVIGQCDDIDRLDDVRLGFLADAFATFTMGPSYACASLMLKLSVEEAERAHVILRSLELAGGTTDEREGNYNADIVQPIRRWWQASPGTGDVAHDRVEALDKFSEVAHLAFYRYFPGAKYPQTRWPDYVEPTASALRQERKPTHGGALLQRDLLNAVWDARLNGEADNDTIAMYGRMLFKQLLDRRQERGGAAGPKAPPQQ